MARFIFNRLKHDEQLAISAICLWEKLQLRFVSIRSKCWWKNIIILNRTLILLRFFESSKVRRIQYGNAKYFLYDLQQSGLSLVIRLIMILNAGLRSQILEKCGLFHQGILSSLVVSQQLCQKIEYLLSNLKQMAQ